MGSHFHDCIDYNGVTRMGSPFLGISGIRKILVSRDLKVGGLAAKNGSLCCADIEFCNIDPLHNNTGPPDRRVTESEGITKMTFSQK